MKKLLYCLFAFLLLLTSCSGGDTGNGSQHSEPVSSADSTASAPYPLMYYPWLFTVDGEAFRADVVLAEYTGEYSEYYERVWSAFTIKEHIIERCNTRGDEILVTVVPDFDSYKYTFDPEGSNEEEAHYYTVRHNTVTFRKGEQYLLFLDWDYTMINGIEFCNTVFTGVLPLSDFDEKAVALIRNEFLSEYLPSIYRLKKGMYPEDETLYRPFIKFLFALIAADTRYDDHLRQVLTFTHPETFDRIYVIYDRYVYGKPFVTRQLSGIPIRLPAG